MNILPTIQWNDNFMNYMMFLYKTRKCPLSKKGQCTAGKNCFDSHNDIVRRRPFQRFTDEFPDWNYIPYMKCKMSQNCMVGKNCGRYHSIDESRYHPLQYKTQACDDPLFMSHGICARGPKCWQYHNENDKRATYLYLQVFQTITEVGLTTKMAPPKMYQDWFYKKVVPRSSVIDEKDSEKDLHLIHNLRSENNQLTREYAEYRQSCESKVKENEQLINTLISKHNRVQYEYDEYKQLSEVKEKSLIDAMTLKNEVINNQNYMEYVKSLNSKITGKDNNIKQLQASIFSSFTQITTLKKENKDLKTELQQLQNKVDEEEKTNGYDTVDICKLKFSDWLCSIVRLSRYLSAFEQNECDDIRMIQFLDMHTVKNDIGIKNNIHCRLLLQKANEFKTLQMEFNQLFDRYKPLKQFKQTFEMNGIFTLSNFKNDVPNKKTLEQLLDFKDKNMIDFMWSIFNTQIPQHKANNEGNETLYI